MVKDGVCSGGGESVHFQASCGSDSNVLSTYVVMEWSMFQASYVVVIVKG